MTPDELRALADALDRLKFRCDGIDDACLVEDAADYLRACADAEPVTWIAHNLTTGHVKWTTDRCRARGWTRSVNLRVKPLYAHPGNSALQRAADYLRAQADAQPVAAGWKLVPVEPTPEMLSAVGMMDGYDWHAPGCSPDADHANWYSAMIAAAPAAPQEK